MASITSTSCEESWLPPPRPIAGTILVVAVGSVLWNFYSGFSKKQKASLEEIE